MWRGRGPSRSYPEQSVELARMSPTAHFDCRLFLLRPPAGGGAGLPNGTAGTAYVDGGTPPGNGTLTEGGAGGSGYIAIRISDDYTASFSGATTSTITSVSGYNIYSVTAAPPTSTVTFS